MKKTWGMTMFALPGMYVTAGRLKAK